MSRLFLVRHGQTDWNVAGRLQGTSDVPLNAYGAVQAAATAQSLADASLESPTVVTSPLSRARATAAAIATALGCDLHVDARLTERAYGVWEGLVEAERREAYPEAHEVWKARGEPVIEGYERHAQVAARMHAAIEEWLERAPGDLIMVTHGSSGRMAILDLLGLPTGGHAIGNLENAAWSRLSRTSQGEWSLERHNVGAD